MLRLLPSGFPGGQARVALKAIETRVSAGEFDHEDLMDVRDRLDVAWPVRGDEIKAELKQPKRAELETAFQNLRTQLEQWRDAMPAAFAPQVPAPLRSDAGQEEVEIRPGPGKRRVVIPRSKQGNVEMRATAGIRFSQATARGTTGAGVPLSTVMKHMATTGWRGDPVEVVQMDASYLRLVLPPQSRGVCSIDNRRLVAAIAAGLSEVPAVVHTPTEVMGAEWAAEAQNVVRYPIWRNADTGEVKVDAKRNFHDVAQPPWVRVFAQGDRPATYGDLIVIRTANQGEMKLLPGLFPVGGSERVPEVTGPVV